MDGGVLGQESFAGRRDESVADVGKDLGSAFRGDGMLDDPDAEFVGGPFETEGYHGEGIVREKKSRDGGTGLDGCRGF